MPEDVDLSNVTSGFMATPDAFQVTAGQSAIRGDIEFKCASGATDCTVPVTVNANDAITATRTDGTVTAINSEDSMATVRQVHNIRHLIGVAGTFSAADNHAGLIESVAAKRP